MEIGQAGLAGNENIKKGSNVATVRQAIHEIDAAGIEAWGYFVLGFPGETKETIEDSIRLACELPLQIAKFDIGAPYPGNIIPVSLAQVGGER